MKGTVDRFEENIAIIELEDRSTTNITKDKLPIDIKEGDIVIFSDNKISIDKEETKKRKQEIHNLMDKLFE